MKKESDQQEQPDFRHTDTWRKVEKCNELNLLKKKKRSSFFRLQQLEKAEGESASFVQCFFNRHVESFFVDARRPFTCLQRLTDRQVRRSLAKKTQKGCLGSLLSFATL